MSLKIDNMVQSLLALITVGVLSIFNIHPSYSEPLISHSFPALSADHVPLKVFHSKESAPRLEIAAGEHRPKLLPAKIDKAQDISKNLVKNPNFEAKDPHNPQKPADWRTFNDLRPPFADLTAQYVWEGSVAPSGRRAVTIKTAAGDKEAGWVQMITGLRPGGWYRVTVWVKTQNMEPDTAVARGAGLVATFFIPNLKDPVSFNSNLVSKDQNWQKQELTFVVPENFTRMALSLNSVRTKGTVSWSDVVLEPLAQNHQPDRNLAGLAKHDTSEFDKYGGWKQINGRATGFFHTQKIGNRWWLITPEGHGFIVAGVFHEHLPLDSVYMANVKRLYHEKDRWLSTLAHRLTDWGFNTFICYPPLPKFAYEAILSPRTQVRIYIDPAIQVKFVTNLDSPAAAVSFFPDVFDPKFKIFLDQDAQQLTKAIKNDPWLLGYSLGGELPWEYFLLDMFLALPEGRPGKQAAVAFLQDRYHNQIQAFNDAAGTHLRDFKDLLALNRLPAERDRHRLAGDRAAFLFLVAKIYFQAGYEAVKKYDSNHMILGARFGGHGVPEEVLKSIAPYTDVVTFQPYDLLAPMESLIKSYQYHRKPVLITEFSFRGADSGLPNTLGAGSTLATQKDRGVFFQRYVAYLLSSPFTVGYVWYRYVDDLPDHNQVFHRENCNYGLVNRNDEPYKELVQRMKALNQRLYYLATRPAGR